MFTERCGWHSPWLIEPIKTKVFRILYLEKPAQREYCCFSIWSCQKEPPQNACIDKWSEKHADGMGINDQVASSLSDLFNKHTPRLVVIDTTITSSSALHRKPGEGTDGGKNALTEFFDRGASETPVSNCYQSYNIVRSGSWKLLWWAAQGLALWGLTQFLASRGWCC